jgi:hypothetical protein
MYDYQDWRHVITLVANQHFAFSLVYIVATISGIAASTAARQSERVVMPPGFGDMVSGGFSWELCAG